MRTIVGAHPALWLPPKFHARSEGLSAQWPQCWACEDAVEAYGIADEGSKRLEIWARCHGKHEQLKIVWDDDSVTGPELVDQIARLIFFRRDDPVGLDR